MAGATFPITITVNDKGEVVKAKSNLEALAAAGLKVQKTAQDSGKAFDGTAKSVGDLADSTGKAVMKLKDAGAAFGVTAQQMQGLDFALDAAEIGFGGLSKSMAGFNAATLGVVAAGAAVGGMIGSWLRTFPQVKKVADDLAQSLFGLSDAQMKGQFLGKGDARNIRTAMQPGFIASQRRQIDAMRGQGRGDEEILAMFGGVAEQTAGTGVQNLRERIAVMKELGFTAEMIAKQESVLTPEIEREVQAHKDAAAAAKQHEQELSRLMSRLVETTRLADEARAEALGAFAGDVRAGGGMDFGDKGLLAGPLRLPGALPGAPEFGNVPGFGTVQASLFGMKTAEDRQAFLDAGNSYESVKKAASAITEAAEKERKAAEEANRWAGALGGVALMAGATTGRLSDTLQIMENIGQGFQGFGGKDKYGKFNAIAGAVGSIGGLIGGKGGSALQGAAGGAMTGFSIGGAPGAIIGGLAGGLLGLFGGDKQKKEAEEARKGFIEAAGGLQELEKAAAEAGVSLDKLFGAKSKEDVEKFKEQFEELVQLQGQLKAAKAEAFAAGTPGVLAGISGIQVVSAEDMRSQATIASLQFFEVFAREGIIAAGDAFGPIAEKLRESLAAIGGDEGADAILGPMLGLIDLSANELFRGAAEGAKGFADVLRGLSVNDVPILQTQFAAFGQQAQTAFDQAIAGGADSAQALQAIAPLLQQIQSAAANYGLEIDSATAELIRQAEQAGISFPVDPIFAMVEAINRLIETLGGIPTDIGINVHTNYSTSGEPPGGAHGGPAGEEFKYGMPEGQHGLISTRTMPILVHGSAGNPEVTAPVAAMLRHIGDAIVERIGAAGGGGGTAVFAIDGREFMRATMPHQKRAIRNDAGGLQKTIRQRAGRG
jgi:hypothetical protein